MMRWKREMSEWKHHQEMWLREFRAWQMATDGDWERPQDGHYSPYPHSPHSPPEWESPDVPDDGWGWLEDMLNEMLPFLNNPDMLCPMFNMIIDESWGLGSGQDWEMGCRNNMKVQNEILMLIENMHMMETHTFAQKTCELIGTTAMGQMEMFGLGMFNPMVMAAEPMCNCVVANIVNIAEGHFKIGEMMECAHQIMGFVEGAMSGHFPMPDGPKGDFSEENIMFVREMIRSSFSSIDFNDDQLRLMRYWDSDGEWEKQGVFDGDSETKLWAMATAVIWTEANHWTELMPGESMDGRFMAVANVIREHMENASSWNQFFENNLKLAMAKWPEVKDWEEFKYYGEEAYLEILGDPVEVYKWMKMHVFIDDNNFMGNMDALSGTQGQFSTLVNEVFNNTITDMDTLDMDYWGVKGVNIEPLINLQNFFNDYLFDPEHPHYPMFYMGLATCLGSAFFDDALDGPSNGTWIEKVYAYKKGYPEMFEAGSCMSDFMPDAKKDDMEPKKPEEEKPW